MNNAAYAATRRRGVPVSVSICSAPTVDEQTGAKVLNVVTHNVRLVVQEPTIYSRLVRARAAQTDVGEVTFIFWTKDISFQRLTPEDYIISAGQRFDVVTSSLESDGLIITTRLNDGNTGKQSVAASATNSLGLDQNAT